MKEKAKGREKQSEYEDQDEQEIGIEEGEDTEVAPVADPGRPICPRCGWHNTRLSHTRSALDSILRAFSLRAFRCRSCGNRFRAIRRDSRE